MDRQQSLDVRRIRRTAMTGQRERLVRPSPAELAAASRATVSEHAAADLELRRRQLQLINLGR